MNEEDDDALERRIWDEIFACEDVQYRKDRWKALRALWLAPPRHDPKARNYLPPFGKDEEWTIWRAVQASIALLLDRRWSDDCGAFGTTVCFFDNRTVYGGYHVMLCDLYPGFRIEIFSDGETSM